MDKKFLIGFIALCVLGLVSATLIEWGIGDASEPGCYQDKWCAQQFQIGGNGTNADSNVSTITLRLWKTGNIEHTVAVMITEVNATNGPDYTKVLSYNSTLKDIMQALPTLSANRINVNITIPSVVLNASTNYSIILNATGDVLGEDLIYWRYEPASYAWGVSWDCPAPLNGSAWRRDVGGASYSHYFKLWGELVNITAPNVTIVSPTIGGIYNNSYVNFNLTVIDDYAPQTCLYSLDSGATNYSMTNDSASNFYNISLKKDLIMGLNTVNFYCNDTFGNLNNSESVSFNMSCLTPYEDMTISGYSNRPNITTLCQGSYNLNGSTTGAIQIGADDIVLDCNRTEIYGNWSATGNNEYIGINVNTKGNITIKNCTLKDYNYGLKLRNANGIIENCNFTGNRMGIYLSTGGFSQNSNITNNTFYNNSYGGIWFYSSSQGDLNIKNNTFYSWERGIMEEPTISNAQNITIENNTFYQYDVHAQITQNAGDNWNISSNTIYGSGLVYAYGMILKGDNNSIKYNWIDHTQYNVRVEGYNITIENNTFINGDQGSSIHHADLVYFYNNTIKNMTQNYDSYNVGIKIFNSTNVYVRWNNWTEIAITGILSQGNTNLTISDNWFDFISISERPNYLAGDGYEPRCAIQSTKRYKGYAGLFGNENLTVKDNTFDSDTPCYLHLENETTLTHDLTNYWYRSFKPNMSWVGKYEFYIPNAIQNLSRWTSSQLTRFDMRISTGSGDSNKYISFKQDQNFSYYENINTTTTFQLNLYNLTDDVIVFDNGTRIYSRTAGNQINITLIPSQYAYVYNDSLGPTISLESPANNGQDTDGVLELSYNVSDTNDVSNCSLFLDGIFEEVDTSITKDTTQTFTITGHPEKDDLEWFVNCTDEINNQGNSTTWEVDTIEGGGGDPGGGGENGNGEEPDLPCVGPDCEEPPPCEGPECEPDCPGGICADVVVPSGGGGGGAADIVTLIEVLAIKTPVFVTIYDTPLEKAKIFKVFFVFCGTEDNELKKCFLTETQADEFLRILREDYRINMDLLELDAWAKQYNNGEIVTVRIRENLVDLWELISRDLTVIEAAFQVIPGKFDKFFLALSPTLKEQILSTRALSSSEVISGIGFGTEITGASTSDLTYTTPIYPPQEIFSATEAKISYTNIDGDTVFQDIRIRIISMKSSSGWTFGLPFWLFLILAGGLVIGFIVLVRRKKIKLKFWKKR